MDDRGDSGGVIVSVARVDLQSHNTYDGARVATKIRHLRSEFNVESQLLMDGTKCVSTMANRLLFYRFVR